MNISQAKRLLKEIDARFPGSEWPRVKSVLPEIVDAVDRIRDRVAAIDAAGGEVAYLRAQMETERDPATLTQLVLEVRRLTAHE